jgi:hypothetical protein
MMKGVREVNIRKGLNKKAAQNDKKMGKERSAKETEGNQ